MVHHMANCVLRTKEDAVLIDRNDFMVIFIAQLMGFRQRADAGVIDEQVNCAELFDREIDHRFHRILACHIHFNEQDVAIVLQALCRLFAAFFIEVGNDHFCTFRQICFCCRQSDSGSSACHHCHFTCQFHPIASTSIFCITLILSELSINNKAILFFHSSSFISL